MRLSIDVTKSQHKAIKAYAVMHGMSMKEFVLERLLTEDLNNFNDETNKVLAASEAGENLHRYDSVDEFIADMSDS